MPPVARAEITLECRTSGWHSASRNPLRIRKTFGGMFIANCGGIRRRARRPLGEWARGYAIDQSMSGERARRELGWRPIHTDPVSDIS